jgi:hypothetical protein
MVALVILYMVMLARWEALETRNTKHMIEDRGLWSLVIVYNGSLA